MRVRATVVAVIMSLATSGVAGASGTSGAPAVGGSCSPVGAKTGVSTGGTLICERVGGVLVWQNQNGGPGGPSTLSPVAAGILLSNGECKGTGDAVFTSLPMHPADFGFLIPYGLMIGGHVTPIDHEYFTPASYNSAHDAYPVFAIANATLTGIEPRAQSWGTEYRLVFAHSCTFLYYYDLLTSLSGRVKSAYATSTHGASGPAVVNVRIKAGEQIGWIGGQTLDFALWRTTTRLHGFVVPAHYDAEAWKIHTTDPFPFYTPALRALLLARDPRVAAPRAGKIDYDVDGKLIGNWFVQGSGGFGYAHGGDLNFFTTHLSFAPDLYDPSYFKISIGSLYSTIQNAPSMQYIAATNAPDPASVNASSGLVKYDLIGWNYVKADGTIWDQMTYGGPVTISPLVGSHFGCAAVQMTGRRTLEFEVFVGVQCSSVTGFDSSATKYTR